MFSPRIPPWKLLPLVLLASWMTACGPRVETRIPDPLPGELPAPTEKAPNRMHFACVDRNVLRAARRIVPLVEYLSKTTGIEIELEIFEDYETELEALLAGRVDLAWVSPTMYVRSRIALKVEPLVRDIRSGTSTYRSVLVVAKDSSVKALKDLEGARVGFVRETSTSGNVFPRAYLFQNSIEPETFFASTEFSGSHAKSLLGVRQGRYDAVFVEDGALDEAQRAHPGTFRILDTVATIPHGPIVAHPSVDPELQALVVQAFVGLGTNPEAIDLTRGLLQATGIQAFRRAEDPDYQDVRRHVLGDVGGEL